MEVLSEIPRHVGFIMDGNGRWAKAQDKPRTYGHRKGAEVIKDVVSACNDFGVNTVTLFAFSCENWKRPKEEVDEIMSLLDDFIVKYKGTLVDNEVRLKVIGDLQTLNKKLQKDVSSVMEETEGFTEHTLNIAISYGARQEICTAINKMIKDGVEKVDENTLSDYLYTAGQPDVDLIVRTSGEQRLSNFLLYQSAYAELYFTDVLWPDFNKEEVKKALTWYATRKRRFGNV